MWSSSQFGVVVDESDWTGLASFRVYVWVCSNNFVSVYNSFLSLVKVYNS